MAIIIAQELGKRLFIWGVLAMVILPRHHIDRTQLSIGGNLSYSFRKLLLCSVVLNLSRLIANLNGHVQWVADVLGILQLVSLSFICFLTPYVLQTWMADRINLPGGKPGGNLIGPLYGAGLLSVLGVVLCRTVHPNLWCIKRLGNIVSTPPILLTMRMYNSLTSVGGHHQGRGSITAQTLVISEYWHLITQLLCVVGFAFDQHHENPAADNTQWDYCLQAFRDIAFVSDWTRVCVHGMFINLLDEMYLTGGSSASNSSNSNNGPSENSYGGQDEEINGNDGSSTPPSYAVTTSSPSTRGQEMAKLVQRGGTPATSPTHIAFSTSASDID